ncbi:hypothetical protein R3P38DRAFT_3367456 [Favolaschia claudopus]|uniref:Uncharacterized protein n=1 Tax=Favolaschia claudopus TaxID=2862362 RepID=A0AAW0A8V0_9AGAR
MPATTSRLRSLLLKTPSMTQPEPFLLSRTMEREGNLGELSGVSGAPVEIRANPVSRKSRNQSESERRSAGQRRRRKREAKKQENDGRLSGIGRPVNLTRSLAQRARRQRELAGDIEDLLDTKGYKGCHRSRAQTLRRRVEQQERRLKSYPECDPTQSLDQALHHEYDVNQPRRNDRYRESYRSRMLRYEDEVRRALLAMHAFYPNSTTTMPSTGHHLRPLLPKTPSMTRPEPFLLKTTRNLESDANVNRDSAQVLNPKEVQLQQLDHVKKTTSIRIRASFSWPKEEKGEGSKGEFNESYMGPATSRSVAQRARRQRELAAKIENLLDIKEHDSQQSRAQKLRRKVEQGERKLRAFPDCDHGRALDEALDHEWMLNQPRREDRHRESQRKISLQSRVDSGQTSIKWFRERPKAPLTSSVRSQTTYDNFVAASPVDRTPLHTQ